MASISCWYSDIFPRRAIDLKCHLFVTSKYIKECQGPPVSLAGDS